MHIKAVEESDITKALERLLQLLLETVRNPKSHNRLNYSWLKLSREVLLFGCSSNNTHPSLLRYCPWMRTNNNNKWSD